MLFVEAACICEIACDRQQKVLFQAPVWKLLETPTKTPYWMQKTLFTSSLCVCEEESHPISGIFLMEMTLRFPTLLFFCPLGIAIDITFIL